MNRRAFLGSLAAAIAGAAFDPERLLWVPGQRTIFVPAPPGAIVTGNHFVLADFVAKEALKILQRNLVFTQRINREYDGRACCITFSIPSRFATR